ncbi:MAG: hypothetical protein ACRC6A_00910 [Fusobacteriaceae bacterium]
MKFLESSLFGNMILILTIIVTILIWYNDKRQKLKNYAQLLLFQIKDIENGIIEIQSNGLNRDYLNESPFLAIPIIFDKNFWDEYSYLFLNKLGVNNYEVISDFYEKSSKIKELQIEIKQKMRESLYWKGYHYYSKKYSIIYDDFSKLSTIEEKLDEINKIDKEISIQTYIPIEYPKQILKILETYRPLKGTVAYSELEKVSKINIF